MNRAAIEDALLAMQMPVGIKGFMYIVDAMEIFEEKGTSISITRELYPTIAKRHDTILAKVERAIRHAFEVVRTKGDIEAVNKYIGTVNCSNSNSLKQLHLILRRERA